MRLLDDLFDATIRLAHGDPRADWPMVLPVEEAAIQRAVERRRREFRAGRTFARRAMLALGVPGAAIKARTDRSPAWPDGVVGSISHCDDVCVAAVGRANDGWLAIGIDIEQRASLPPELATEVCGSEEQVWLASLPAAERGDFARLIFSAKECAYKCQHVLSGRLLAFDALTIRIDPVAGLFTARFNESAAPFRAGDELVGRYSMDADHMMTAISLRRGQMALGAAGQLEVLRSHG